jgi:PAT family beta-lactamase induction signal transducer AmpG
MNKLKAVLRNPNLLVVFLMGFSSGLPFLMVGGTLKTWMREAGIDLSTIGFFSVVALPYSLKFLWAPVMDRYVPPLGRRRGWLLISQLGIMFSVFALAQVDPVSHTALLGIVATVVAFFAASQDIVIDAYRREILPEDQLGLGSSFYIPAFRLAMLLVGAGSFSFSKRMSWPNVYLLLGSFMLIGVLTTLFCKEPKTDVPPPRSLAESVFGPLKEFFSRDSALLILAFILLYKLGEAMATGMLNPLYIDLRIDKDAIAGAAKFAGFWATAVGGIVGGLLILKMGIPRALWVFGILQSAGLLFFSYLAHFGQNLIAMDPSVKTVDTVTILPLLTASIGIENFTAGMATTAFVAFMATQTNKRFTATQYALLTSLMAWPSSLFGILAGVLADKLGWEMFFVACTIATIPGLMIAFWMKRLHHHEPEPETEAGPSRSAQLAAKA